MRRIQLTSTMGLLLILGVTAVAIVTLAILLFQAEQRVDKLVSSQITTDQSSQDIIEGIVGGGGKAKAAGGGGGRKAAAKKAGDTRAGDRGAVERSRGDRPTGAKERADRRPADQKERAQRLAERRKELADRRDQVPAQLPADQRDQVPAQLPADQRDQVPAQLPADRRDRLEKIRDKLADRRDRLEYTEDEVDTVAPASTFCHENGNGHFTVIEVSGIAITTHEMHPADFIIVDDPVEANEITLEDCLNLG